MKVVKQAPAKTDLLSNKVLSRRSELFSAVVGSLPIPSKIIMLIPSLESAASSSFGLNNLPLGVFTHSPSVVHPRCCTRLGDVVIDLAVLEEAGLFDDIPGLAAQVFSQETLNDFIAHPQSVWVAFRQRLTELLSGNSILDTLHSNAKLQEAAFHLVADVKLHLPIQVGDYTDFYASREHATNVG
jgi:fumarylacetoacetase